MRVVLGLVAALAVSWVPPVPAGAQSLDAASATALAATLRLLQDPAQRDAVIAGNPQAAAADRQMQGMLGTREVQEEFYAITAAIFADVTQRSMGDAGRMAQMLAAGQADPAGFLASLSPQTVERLRAFAGKISSQKP
jgi:hypothetical protein